MPTVVWGNANGACIMIGEQCTDLILAARYLALADHVAARDTSIIILDYTPAWRPDITPTGARGP
jgi:hypothetical protein